MGMRGRKRKKEKQTVKQKESEDWCFKCKDGGDLIICEHSNCLKVYHPSCAGQNDSSAKNGESWSCARHSCSKCHKSSKFYCYCCPTAVCGQCIEAGDFAHVKGNKGLCEKCVEFILELEENNQGEIDTKDRDTEEGLFMEYWEIIKEQEGLSLDDAYLADAKLQKGNSFQGNFKSSSTGKCKRDIELLSSDNDVDDIEDLDIVEGGKRSKVVEFAGWGSKVLIEFLISLGKYTTRKLSQDDVYSIISEYIREKGLADPKNKKRIVCDERLYSVFRRKILYRNKINNLIEAHFVEDLDQSDDQSDEDEDLIETENCFHNKKENGRQSYKKHQIFRSDNKSQDMEAPTVKESCFASIISDNIKLVYLRRGLVEKLFNDPESAEKKVVRSFVRVKNDSRDRLQNNSHQLLQVTGIKRIRTGANSDEIVLNMINVSKDVSISLLSDIEFCEEEINELRQQVEMGLLPKPTVVELEEKAKFLHEDITKDWIEKELVTLQKRIDFTNEKGWRREMNEYLDQLEHLKKPLVQERLIKRSPKVVAELVEHKASLVDL